MAQAVLGFPPIRSCTKGMQGKSARAPMDNNFRSLAHANITLAWLRTKGRPPNGMQDRIQTARTCRSGTVHGVAWEVLEITDAVAGVFSVSELYLVSAEHRPEAHRRSGLDVVTSLLARDMNYNPAQSCFRAKSTAS